MPLEPAGLADGKGNRHGSYARKIDDGKAQKGFVFVEILKLEIFHMVSNGIPRLARRPLRKALPQSLGPHLMEISDALKIRVLNPVCQVCGVDDPIHVTIRREPDAGRCCHLDSGIGGHEAV